AAFSGQRRPDRTVTIPQALAPAQRGRHHLRLADRGRALRLADDVLSCPALSVAQTPFFNAGAYGIDQPFIVIHSAAIELLDDEELRVLLSHEMGHVMRRHAL